LEYVKFGTSWVTILVIAKSLEKFTKEKEKGR
jgi:hypothetical protein